MFVVFEGIDGSGKTTVSNRVADNLRARGVEVNHIREGGEYGSTLVERMRQFGKDPRNMVMDPVTELLFYVARDAQLLAEAIRPALSEGGLVFADRYLYSYEVLSHFGRGLDRARVRQIIDAVAGGLWPDLVVLMDVDPHIARARRKVSKLQQLREGHKPKPGSRKGLGGIGVQHRLCAGYRSIAAREHERWLVVDNADPDTGLDAIVEAVADAVFELWEGKASREVIAGARVSSSQQVRLVASELEAGMQAFYEVVSARAAAEPAVAAYLLARLDDDQAYRWRKRLADEAPRVVASGLTGLGDEQAWELRDALVDRAPVHVARSLDGFAVEGPRAEAMRAELAGRVPEAVLSGLGGIDTDAAWELRSRLQGDHLAHVVRSLKRLDSDRAWELRERFLGETDGVGDEPITDPEAAQVLASSVRGLSGDRAWAIRDRCLDAAPSQVLASLAGVTDERSWALRAARLAHAPKIVLRTIDGLDDRRAWQMRRTCAVQCKEALDSMVGLDGEAAWNIRAECADVWPSTTVKSLGALADTGPGRELALLLLGRSPDNISLLKHITRIVSGQMSRSDPAAGSEQA